MKSIFFNRRVSQTVSLKSEHATFYAKFTIIKQIIGYIGSNMTKKSIISIICQLDKKDAILIKLWPIMDYYFKLNYPPFFFKLLLGKARLYDFDPEGNYRELGVKKI